MRKTPVAVAVFVAGLAGCAVGPNYVRPQPADGMPFPTVTDDTTRADAVVAHYWNLFGDDTLVDLERDASAANHDLRIAQARFDAARGARRETRLDLVPTVTADGGRTRMRLAEAQSPGTSRSARTSEVYDLGFDAFWELDFFGRVRREVEAARADAAAAESAVAAARIIIGAEVARNYLELRGQQEQLATLERNAAVQRGSLELTQVRLDAGRGTELDVARARTQLGTTEALIPPLESSISATIHRLGVLTGRDPRALADRLATPAPLPTLPEVVAIGEPADLLQRRPDVRAAERELAAATARIGVATADLFPRVSFTGSYGGVAANSGDLGDADARNYSFGPRLSWPLFDLGRVHARIDQSKAHASEALARYEQTVLRSLEETDDALVAYGRARRERDRLADAASASADASRLARLRFEGGVSDFLTVLDAERVQLEAESRLAAARTRTATALVAVYKALGGD